MQRTRLVRALQQQQQQQQQGSGDVAWRRLLRQCSSKMVQQTRMYDGAGTRIPVRGIVAASAIVRGERLAVVPSSSVLDGYAAARIVHRFCAAEEAAASTTGDECSDNNTERTRPRLRCYVDVVRTLHTLAADATSTSSSADDHATALPVDVPFASRDALLVTAALHFLRHRCDAQRRRWWRHGASHELRDMHAWAHAMPPRVPPLGVLLHRYYMHDATFTPLQRRHRHTPSRDAATAASSLSLSSPHAAEQQRLLAVLADDDNDDNDNDSDSNRTALALRHDTALQRAVATRRETDVTLTSSMLHDYLAGNALALTRRQHETVVARTRRPAAAAGLRCLQQLERRLRRRVLRPLRACLYTTPTACRRGNRSDDGMCASDYSSSSNDENDDDDEDDDDDDVMSGLQWAHFMTRSRAVNVYGGIAHDDRTQLASTACQLALVPLLDMLNHSHHGGNVVYQRQRDTHDLVVTASRAIAAGEELVLHYGHRTQRAVLDYTQPPSSLSSSAVALAVHSASNNNNNTDNDDARPSSATPADAKRARLAAHVRHIEAQQRYEMHSATPVMVTTTTTSAVDGGGRVMRTVADVVQPVCDVMHTTTSHDDVTHPASSAAAADAYDATSATALASLPHAQQQQAVAAQREAVAEVRWLWRYGFYRTRDERLYEASAQWSRTLRQRVAQLTDVRRKGRPGEFVLGVPENLQRLREQRERLERERYHNTRVFPPQRS